eukprot:TRINITY_DN8190_c0_g1_i3.p1 TRINITY_DN8190_c0_g1~~TRINITY_DN8190_c0_g1_i3.p1  ORF type:complete len:638 (+),score=168.43 TRINITY_DN8190_c0_g1_i3:573-2486(+)
MEFNKSEVLAEKASVKMASEDMISAITSLLRSPDDKVTSLVEEAMAALKQLRDKLATLPDGVEVQPKKANVGFAQRIEDAIQNFQTAMAEKMKGVGDDAPKHWIEASEEMLHLRKVREEIGKEGGFLDALTAKINGTWFQQSQADVLKYETVLQQMQLLHDILFRFDTFDKAGKYIQPRNWRNDLVTALHCMKVALSAIDPHFEQTWDEGTSPKYPDNWTQSLLSTPFQSVCYTSKDPPVLQDSTLAADRVQLATDGLMCDELDDTIQRLWLIVDLLKVVHLICQSKMSWFRGPEEPAPAIAAETPWFRGAQEPLAQQQELQAAAPRKQDHGTAAPMQQQVVAAVRRDDVAAVHSAIPVTQGEPTPVGTPQMHHARPTPVDTRAVGSPPPPLYNPEALNKACASKFDAMSQGKSTLDQASFRKAFIEPSDPANAKPPTQAQIQLTQRLFQALDKDNDGKISFEEYHEAMRVYHNGTFEERAELVWKVYAGNEEEVFSDSLKQVSKGCLDMVKNDVMNKQCLSPVHRDLLASAEEGDVEDSLNQSINSLKGEINSMQGTSPTKNKADGFVIQKDAFIQMCKKSASMQVGVNPAFSPSASSTDQLSPSQPGFMQTHGGYNDAGRQQGTFGQQHSLNQTR